MLAILNIRSRKASCPLLVGMTLKCMFGIWWIYQAFYLTSLPKLFGSFHDRLAQAAWVFSAWWISGIMEMVWIVPWNLTLKFVFFLHFQLINTVLSFLLLVVDVCIRVSITHHAGNLQRRTYRYIFYIANILNTVGIFVCGSSRTCRHAGFSLESMLKMHIAIWRFGR